MKADQLTVREEQQALTRQRILEACAVLALRYGGLDDPARFTYQRVAELAGVSERTVYRLFPTKKDLSDAFLDARTLTRGEPLPSDLGDLAPFLRRVCHAWDAQFPRSDDDPVAPAGDAEDGHDAGGDESSRSRDRVVEAAVALAVGDAVPPEQRRAIAGVVRLVLSLRSVAQTAARFDLTLAEAGEAHAWAVDTLVQALRREEVPPWTPNAPRP